MNSSGWAGKFGSGTTAASPNTKECDRSDKRDSHLSLLSLLGATTDVVTRLWLEYVWLRRFLGGEFVGSVQNFGNEGLILDEGKASGRFWPTERQLDQRQ